MEEGRQDGAALQVTRFAIDDRDVLAAWKELQADGHVPTPFLTWQWAAAMAAVPDAAASRHVLCVAQAGRVLGLLPLEQWIRPGGVRVLGPAGGHSLGPDHIDVVAAPGHRHQVASAVVRHVVRHADWDVLDMEGVSRGGALGAQLTVDQWRGALRLPERAVRAPYVTLQGSRTSLLRSRNLRQQVARGRRTAERSGGGFSTYTTPEQVVARLPLLMQLHNERHGSASQVFATPERRRFHVEAARRLSEAGLARVYALQYDGEDVSLMYALRLEKRLYYYSMGMRARPGGSPGQTVLGQAILAAMEEGFDEFDLLRGDHQFKMRFANGMRCDSHVRLARPTLRSLAHLARHVPSRLRSSVTSWLPR